MSYREYAYVLEERVLSRTIYRDNLFNKIGIYWTEKTAKDFIKRKYEREIGELVMREDANESPQGIKRIIITFKESPQISTELQEYDSLYFVISRIRFYPVCSTPKPAKCGR